MLDPASEMTDPPAAQPPAVLPIERVAAAIEVILCSGFPTQLVVMTFLAALGLRPSAGNGDMSGTFVFALTFLDTALLVGLIVFFLRAHREPVRRALFGTAPLGREALVGVALIPASFFIVISVLLLVLKFAPWLRNVPHNPLGDLARTRAEAIALALVAMLAGVREEIQRGFVLRRFEQYLGGAPIGLLMFSVLFGLGHYEQGHDAMLATGLLGAFWGTVFLVRRSVAAPMVGHAGFNLLQVMNLVFGRV